MNNKPSKKKLEIESQLASSMLYYDIDEFREFESLWDQTEGNQNFEVSGIFYTFVKHMKMIMTQENAEYLNKQFVMSKIRELNMNEPNEAKQFKYNTWLDEVEKNDDPERFRLGEELFYNYAWEIFKESVDAIDKSDTEFKEKLLVTPVRIDYTEVDNIFTKASDHLPQDRDDDITTGFDELDKFVKPNFSNLFVIAARPSVGKSTLMLKMALENAKNGIQGLFISLEMTKKQIFDKMYAWYKGGPVTAQEAEEIKQEEEFQRIDANINYVVNYSNNGEALIDITKKSIDKHGTQMVYVDYLQLIRFPKKDEWQSLRDSTYQLKQLATSENVLVAACTQAHRESENTGIELSSLFGASTIEADSDIVIGMEKSNRNLFDSKTKRGDVKVLKNRVGQSDIKIKTLMDYVNMQFYKLEE